MSHADLSCYEYEDGVSRRTPLHYGECVESRWSDILDRGSETDGMSHRSKHLAYYHDKRRGSIHLYTLDVIG